MLRKPLLWACFALYLATFLGLTLVFFRSPPRPLASRLNLVPMVGIARFLRGGGRAMVVNVAGNLAATVPLGVLLPILAPTFDRAWRIALASFGLSLGIELLQLASRQRVADIDDLILNTAGGLLGLAALRLLRDRRGVRLDAAGEGRRNGSRGVR